MEYVQERVTTLHDFGDAVPPGPLARTAVVVPVTARDHGSRVVEQVLSTLDTVDPARVVLALRADASDACTLREWVRSTGVDADVLWCNAPAVETLLGEHGLDGPSGKGRDVWLALGVAAAREQFVVAHDADATTYGPAHVPRLAFPLDHGYSFVKGYYARVEDDRLYGRLERLLYEPLVAALGDILDRPVIEYLGAFRYGLAGEFAATASLVRRMRVQRTWGLEVGTLGEAFDQVGFEGSAQVDLGVHEHEHRSVGGPDSLSEMAADVTAALVRVLEDADVDVDYAAVGERYRDNAERLLDQYATDAAFNGLSYDREGEREQVATYDDAVGPPGPDTRLPAWEGTDLEPDAVLEAARTALASRD
jgi:glucosyl-3-phosphoglycerate synthase